MNFIGAQIAEALEHEHRHAVLSIQKERIYKELIDLVPGSPAFNANSALTTNLFVQFFLDDSNIDGGFSFTYCLHIRHRRVLVTLKDGVNLLECLTLCLDPEDRLEDVY